MNYSFTKARDKAFIFQDTKVWITFIIISMALMLGVNQLLRLQVDLTNRSIVFNNSKQKALQTEMQNIKVSTEGINYTFNFIENIYSNNIVVKDSIENLFEFVPKQITLTTIKMTKDDLTIQGITPSEDIYNYLLAIPLRSIFEESSVDFTATENGWHNFTSVSRFESIKDGPKATPKVTE